MSPRSAAILLFVVALLVVPFPLFGLAGSLVPAARYLQLAAVMLALIAQEGAGGMVLPLAGLLVAHALFYSGCLAVLAWVLGRVVLSRLSGGARRTLVWVAVIVMLVSASFAPLYDSQFHHASAHARLLDLYR